VALGGAGKRVTGVSGCNIRPLVYLGGKRPGVSASVNSIHVVWDEYRGKGSELRIRLKTSSFARPSGNSLRVNGTSGTRAAPTASQLRLVQALKQVIAVPFDILRKIWLRRDIARCVGRGSEDLKFKVVTKGIWMRAAFGLVMLTFATAASPQAPRAEVPSTSSTAQLQPSQTRALELLQALKSYDLATARKFIEQSFSPEALAKMPVGHRVWYMMQDVRRIRDASFVRWESVTDTQAKLAYRNGLLYRIETIGVQIEPASPHRIVSWTGPSPVPSTAPPPKSDRELAARLNAFAQRMADYDFFSGTVLITKADKPVLAKAYGLAERNFKVANRLDTKMRAASISKMFTAVAVGQLVDQGKLSLEDPLSKFVPDAPGAGRVTIRHLLSHTSGITVPDDDDIFATSPSTLRNLDDWINLTKNRELTTEPGKSFQYNNLGFVYLGKVIEKIAGEDYYDFVQKNVFRPAGMINTSCPHLDVPVDRLAYPYETEFDLGAPTFVNMMVKGGARIGPSGCAVTTVEDMARFAQALRDGKLLKPETLREFTKVVSDTGRLWGLGFYSTKLGQTEILTVGHGGNSFGVCAQFGMFKHQGIPWTFTILSNSGLLACNPMVSETTRLLGQRLTGLGATAAK
jgi:CubicO group peptidase (beta-lactamase class C family)